MTPEEDLLWRCVDRAPTDSPVAVAVKRAYLGELIPVLTALRIAEAGELFRTWLLGRNHDECGLQDPCLAALVWTAAEITRQKLRWDDRPGAFQTRFHHEVLEAVAPVETGLSCDALRKRLPRVERRFRAFQAEMRAACRAMESLTDRDRCKSRCQAA